VVNHVIADAWGLTVFMKDALEVYLSLREGKDLPEKPASFLKVIEEELKYTDSQKMKDDEEYWKSVFDEAPSYSSVNRKNVGKKYGRISLDFTSTAKIITIPKEEVQVVNDYCKKNRISPQVLFILAMYCYLSMLNNKDELLINNALSRRSSIDVKRASGMRLYLTIMDIADSGSLQFIYEYQIKALDEEDIINIHSFIIRTVETGIENPEMTLQQIIEESEKKVYQKFLFEN
ncbi:condensation domain-containing protein, partial [Inconstantimicrobium porci]|uniref:condensation domain-containing protein n=1 Tax=Inconstantimicrobium porci TaxID=2652291 RepID=UPI002409A233